MSIDDDNCYVQVDHRWGGRVYLLNGRKLHLTCFLWLRSYSTRSSVLISLACRGVTSLSCSPILLPASSEHVPCRKSATVNRHPSGAKPKTRGLLTMICHHRHNYWHWGHHGVGTNSKVYGPAIPSGSSIASQPQRDRYESALRTSTRRTNHSASLDGDHGTVTSPEAVAGHCSPQGLFWIRYTMYPSAYG